MRNYLVLSLLLMFCSLIISSCGGGDGVSQPSSLSTPVPLDPSQTGYIIIKVKWPQNGITTSEKEEKTIISSWIAGTKQVFVEILDKDGNSFDPKLTASITQPEEEAKIELIPITKVIVRAKAYDITGAPSEDRLLSTAEKKVNINVGYNKFDLDMGHYNLTWEPSSQTIAVNEDTSLTAKLEIAYNTPEDPNEEQPTPAPVNNKQLTFITDPNSTGMVEILPSVPTDPNGICTVKLIGKEEGNIKIIASLEQDDPNNPNYNIKIDGILAWKDDFESYDVGNWPDPLWKRAGSADPNNATDSYLLNCIEEVYYEDENYGWQTTKAFNLTGGRTLLRYIGAEAYRSLDPNNGVLNPPYEIRFKIRQEYGNPFDTYRGKISISNNPGFIFAPRNVLLFFISTYDYGKLSGYGIGGWNAPDFWSEAQQTRYKIGNFSTFGWYSTRILVSRENIKYKFKKEPYGTPLTYTSDPNQPLTGDYSNLVIASVFNSDYVTGEKYSVWYDDVKIYSKPPSEF